MKYTLEVSYHNKPGEYQVQIHLKGFKIGSLIQDPVIGASTLKGALRQVVQRIVAQEDIDRDLIGDR